MVPTYHLTEGEAEALRQATRALHDAMRRAELAAARAKVEVAEAQEVQIATLRALGQAYGFNPDRPWVLQDDGALVEAKGR